MREINIWQLFSTGKGGIFRVSEIRSISFLFIPFFKMGLQFILGMV
jgi:hypothetical protein